MRINKIIPLLLTVILILGILPGTALAVEDVNIYKSIELPDISGVSFNIKDDVLKLYSPYVGYEGVELIDKSDKYHRYITWTIEDGIGTLRFIGSYYINSSIWFEGGKNLKEVVIEAEHANITSPVIWPLENEPSFALRAKNTNLTITGLYGNYGLFFANNAGQEYYCPRDKGNPCPDELYGVIVEDGNLTIDRTWFSASAKALHTHTKISAGCFVKNGNINATATSQFNVKDDTAYAPTTDFSDGWQNRPNPLSVPSYALYTNGKFTNDGQFGADAIGNGSSLGTIIHADSIHFGYGSAAVTTAPRDAKATFNTQPTYLGDAHSVKTNFSYVEWTVWRYEYRYTGEPVEYKTQIHCNDLNYTDSEKWVYKEGEDFDETTLALETHYTDRDEYTSSKKGFPDDFIILNGNKLEPDTKIIWIQYKDRTIGIPVTVIDSNGITGSPIKTQAYASFADIDKSSWYFNDVITANQLGLIDGKTPTLFAPNDEITFAEIIKLAACMNQLYTNGRVTLVNGTDKWYSSYMDYALEKGITTSDISEKATDVVTRSEYVAIFYNALPASAYAQINQVADNAIPDVKSDDLNADVIYAFYRAGILAGADEKGTFLPDKTITRCEVATILTRMMNNDARKSVSL